MASKLGNLSYVGQVTLLSTQASLGAINAARNLYSINTGLAQSPHVALFAPGNLGQGTGALGAGIGFGAFTLQPSLYTRAGATVVYYNPNTTAAPGELFVQYLHSGIQ